MSKVMLVEDDDSLREIYSIRLTAEGYNIVSAHDGEEALAIAVRERPDLIVSDVMMPKITGFDMLDILRSTAETQNIKVIMMTALSSEEERIKGENLGADRYLVKSQVGIEDVVNAVHDVLGDRNKDGVVSTTANAAPAAAPQSAAPAQAPATQPTAAPAQVVPAAPVSVAQPAVPVAPTASAQPVPVQTIPQAPAAPVQAAPQATQVAPNTATTQVAPAAQPTAAPVQATSQVAQPTAVPTQPVNNPPAPVA